MQNDQNISQSVDNLISQTPDDHDDITTPKFSLGANPQPASDPQQQVNDPGGGEPSSAPSVSSDSQPASQPVAVSTDLQQIKQQALSQLSPIVSELDQEPEEKYRTLMMLIQASDDQKLISAAYEAANQIQDKKARAEALLNIVNEINYFSGQSNHQPEQS